MFTPKQKKLFDKLCMYEMRYGYPPTLREIAVMIGTRKKPSAISTAQYYIKALEKKGYLKRIANIERGIEISNRYF